MTLTPQSKTQSPPTLTGIANVFVRYENFTLGGGSATSAVLRGQLIDKREWIDADAFTLCFALGRLTPGTNVLAFCTGVGWLLRGVAGALVALVAASIPCTAMVVVATALFSLWQNDYWVQAALRGAIAGAVAVTVKTCWTIVHPHVRKGWIAVASYGERPSHVGDQLTGIIIRVRISIPFFLTGRPVM